MAGDPSGNGYAGAIVEAISQPLLVLDGDLSIKAANPAFLKQFEVSSGETLGRRIYELGNGQWDIPELRLLLEEMLSKNGRVDDFRVEHDFDNIGERIMLLNANRMRREGAPDLILLAISDVTERERLRFEIEGHKEFAEKLIDSVRESLLILHWDLRVHSANASFYNWFKVTQDETVGHLVYELGNGQWDIPELRQLLEHILPQNSTFDDFEVEHEFENIGRRSMLLNGRRLDHLDLIVLAIRDVTGQREQEGRQKTLMGELQHRVKNILNNVRALASQTRRSSRGLDDFFEAFEARLGALARAQDLLVKSPSEAVAVQDIVCLELASVGAEAGKEFTATGPAVRLPPQVAQALAMTIHELTTNAAKYGALKAEAGRIEITWLIEDRQERPHLCLDWRERGVRIEDIEPRKGFGSRVIEESLPHMLGGTATLSFHPDGAACRLAFPVPG